MLLINFSKMLASQPETMSVDDLRGLIEDYMYQERRNDSVEITKFLVMALAMSNKVKHRFHGQLLTMLQTYIPSPGYIDVRCLATIVTKLREILRNHSSERYDELLAEGYRLASELNLEDVDEDYLEKVGQAVSFFERKQEETLQRDVALASAVEQKQPEAVSDHVAEVSASAAAPTDLRDESAKLAAVLGIHTDVKHDNTPRQEQAGLQIGPNHLGTWFN